jgi:mannose-1-phosphate guanylyltransferase
MRGMILAAGLGTRLLPLSERCAKPAMPVRGIPVIAHTLTWLFAHDVSEVVINLHHLPDTVRDAVERHRPPGMEVTWSVEQELLGTGGGMRAVEHFLAGSDPSVVVAGDMLVDFDLRSAVARHLDRGDRYTLLLRGGDPRAEAFGTLGSDEEGCLRRIGDRFDLGGETQQGLFMGIRIVAARCLDQWPDATGFEDLTDWLGPQLRAGCRDIRTETIPAGQSLWEPVGTADEYLAANLDPPPLSYASEIPGEREATMQTTDVIVGRGATLEAGARLERVVVWPNETVPADTVARDGVYAGGHFVAASPPSPTGSHEGPLPDEQAR